LKVSNLLLQLLNL